MTRAELLSLLRATGCAVECGNSVFLRDPNWSAAEKVQAEVIFSEARDRTAPLAEGWLGIRTGGSGGGMKFARHDEQTLSAAVRGFCEHFGLTQVNAVDVLPAHHVSGLMARVRCAITGGRHVAWEWKGIERGEFPPLHQETEGKNQETGDRRQETGEKQETGDGRRGTADPSPDSCRLSPDPWVISLVPTQLARLLQMPDAVAWLRGFAIIFLGSGPTWPELADAAAKEGLRVSLSYGMTETAAMVAALRPEEFLAGDRSSGAAMPHAKISIASDDRVMIATESLFRGYFAMDRQSSVLRPPSSVFRTEDLGRIDERGRLHVLGRADAVIITGGKKVNPSEVEVVLRASGEFSDVAVIGLPDAEWGQVVVACYPAGGKKPDVVRAVAGLAAHQRPKRFVAIAEWPRNAQGKIDRRALAERADSGSIGTDLD